MRAILIDWLVEVHLKFKVRPCKALARQDPGSHSRQGVQPRVPHISLTGAASPAMARWNKLVRGLQLMPETLFLTMNLIDRFLEARSMTRKNLQLVGAWCTRVLAPACLIVRSVVGGNTRSHCWASAALRLGSAAGWTYMMSSVVHPTVSSQQRPLK